MRLPFSTPRCTVGAFNRCCRRRVRIDFPAGKGSRRLSRQYHNPLPAPFAPFSRTRGKGFLQGDDKNDPLFGGFFPSPLSKTGVFPGRGKVNRGKPTEKWCLFLMLLKRQPVILSCDRLEVGCASALMGNPIMLQMGITLNWCFIKPHFQKGASVLENTLIYVFDLLPTDSNFEFGSSFSPT